MSLTLFTKTTKKKRYICPTFHKDFHLFYIVLELYPWWDGFKFKAMVPFSFLTIYKFLNLLQGIIFFELYPHLHQLLKTMQINNKDTFLSNWHGNYNSLAAFSWGNMPMSWWILLKHGWSFVKRNTCWNNIIPSNNQLNDITMKQLLLILRWKVAHMQIQLHIYLEKVVVPQSHITRKVSKH